MDLDFFTAASKTLGLYGIAEANWAVALRVERWHEGVERRGTHCLPYIATDATVERDAEISSSIEGCLGYGNQEVEVEGGGAEVTPLVAVELVIGFIVVVQAGGE